MKIDNDSTLKIFSNSHQFFDFRILRIYPTNIVSAFLVSSFLHKHAQSIFYAKFKSTENIVFYINK
jgi:hypothetical protein